MYPFMIGELIKYAIGGLIVRPHFTLVIERTFGSAELLLWGSAQMTELFSVEHRTFFPYYIQCQWHPFIFLFFLHDPHVQDVIIGLYEKKHQRMSTEPKLE